MFRRITCLCVLAACSDSQSDPQADASPQVDPTPVHAIFEVPQPGAPPPSGFYGLPFPNDVRVGDDGRIDLEDHPRPNDLIDLYLDTVAERQRGFGLSSGAFVLFDGALEPASLPVSPAASRQPSSAIYLIDVDVDSPDFGERVPLLTKFAVEGGEGIAPNSLAVLPYPGFVLREQTTYALVATRRLATPAGLAVLPAEQFLVIAGADVPEDAALARAQAIYAPLWQWLDQPGDDEREDVVAAAVFTTQDATSLPARAREVIHRDLPVPRPHQLLFRTSALGYAWYDGMYDGPTFQQGQIPYSRPEDGGAIEVDGTGEPILYSVDEMRFSLTIPFGPMPETGWPTVIYAHGTSGDYHSFVRDGTAGRLAAYGIACISIDQVLHGRRNRLSPPDLAFFNLQNPLAVRDNALQGAIDDFQLLRLVKNFDVVERRSEGRRIKLDGDKIYFFGHSQGSLTGVPFVAHEPDVKGALFSGAGGVLYLSLLHKTQPIDIAGLVKLFLRDVPLDEFNPFLALLQMYMERADSASYGRLLLAEPPDGTPQNVFLSEGLVDRYTPIPSIEALATAMRIDPIEPVLSEIAGLELAGRDPLDPPVTGNWDGATAGLLQYREVADSDGHFVVFDVGAARTQSILFFSSLVASGEATIYED